MRVRLIFAMAATAVATAVAVPALSTSFERSARATPLRASLESAVSRDAARRLVRSFFQAVNSRAFVRACSLLGEDLRNETGGSDCPRFLAFGAPEPRGFRILGARAAASRVAVYVILDFPELDHVRRLRWVAYVGLEGGRPKILETRRTL